MVLEIWNILINRSIYHTEYLWVMELRMPDLKKIKKGILSKIINLLIHWLIQFEISRTILAH